jgi:DNA polymerase-3 subunit epsilon
MRKILFFDTETTGVPINYAASYTEVDNWPRVISLAWILAGADGKDISRGDYLIKPDGWQMPTEEFWTRNGYSQQKSEAEGVPIAEVLELFYQDKVRADLLVAHNLNFDHRIAWAEFIRAGREPRSGMAKFCTMAKSTSICKIPTAKGRGFKWPKLEEAYHFFFNRGFEGAHDAGADVRACKEIFFELISRGHYDLNTICIPKPLQQ